MITVTTNNLLRVTTVTAKGPGGRNKLGVYISKIYTRCYARPSASDGCYGVGCYRWSLAA